MSASDPSRTHLIWSAICAHSGGIRSTVLVDILAPIVGQWRAENDDVKLRVFFGVDTAWLGRPLQQMNRVRIECIAEVLPAGSADRGQKLVLSFVDLARTAEEYVNKQARSREEKLTQSTLGWVDKWDEVPLENAGVRLRFESA